MIFPKVTGNIFMGKTAMEYYFVKLVWSVHRATLFTNVAPRSDPRLGVGSRTRLEPYLLAISSGSSMLQIIFCSKIGRET